MELSKQKFGEFGYSLGLERFEAQVLGRACLYSKGITDRGNEPGSPIIDRLAGMNLGSDKTSVLLHPLIASVQLDGINRALGKYSDALMVAQAVDVLNGVTTLPDGRSDRLSYATQLLIAGGMSDQLKSYSEELIDNENNLISGSFGRRQP